MLRVCIYRVSTGGISRYQASIRRSCSIGAVTKLQDNVHLKYQYLRPNMDYGSPCLAVFRYRVPQTCHPQSEVSFSTEDNRPSICISCQTRWQKPQSTTSARVGQQWSDESRDAYSLVSCMVTYTMAIGHCLSWSMLPLKHAKRLNRYR